MPTIAAICVCHPNKSANPVRKISSEDISTIVWSTCPIIFILSSAISLRRDACAYDMYINEKATSMRKMVGAKNPYVNKLGEGV